MDVARRARVSLATASRVLSGSDYPVNDEMRQRVEAAANDLDYVPNAQARALVHGNPRTVGILVGDVGDPYFSEIVAGLQELATELQYLVMIVNTHRSIRHEVDAFRALRAQRVGIAIIAGSGLVDPRYEESMTVMLRSAHLARSATVVVGRHGLSTDVPSVAVDNAEAGRSIGRHLHGLGHRNVGVLAGSMDLNSTIDRIEGIRSVLGGGLQVLPVDPTRDGGWYGTGRLLEEHPGLTAVVGTADQMAIGAMVWLREHGIDVPGDVSVVGCNDIWVSRDLAPSLTTVRLPLREMGAAALRLGIEARNGVVSHVRLPVNLIVRASSGPARS
jgi:LacI family transcriptional regulator